MLASIQTFSASLLTFSPEGTGHFAALLTAWTIVHLCRHFSPPPDRSSFKAEFLCKSTHNCIMAGVQLMLAPEGPGCAFIHLTSPENFIISSLPFLKCTSESDFVLFWVEMIHGFEQGWDNFSFISILLLDICWLFFKLQAYTML